MHRGQSSFDTIYANTNQSSPVNSGYKYFRPTLSPASTSLGPTSPTPTSSYYKSNTSTPNISNYGSYSKPSTPGRSINLLPTPVSTGKGPYSNFATYSNPNSPNVDKAPYLSNPIQSTSPLRSTYSTNSSPNISSSTRSLYSKNNSPIPNSLSSSFIVESTENAVNVISRFRDLQEQSRLVEQDCSNAIRDRDILKYQLADSKQELEIELNQENIKNSTSLINTATSTDKLKTLYSDLNMKQEALDNIYRSLQKGILAQRNLCSNLETDVQTITSNFQSQDYKNNLIKNEIKVIEERCIDMENKIKSGNLINNYKVKSFELQSNIATLQGQIDSTKTSNSRANIKLVALTRYMKLMVSINDDLCSTVNARENTKAHILSLSTKYSLSPTKNTSSSSKQVPYSEILTVISDAAISTANDASKINKRVKSRDSRPYSSPSKVFDQIYESNGRAPFTLSEEGRIKKTIKKSNDESRMSALRAATKLLTVASTPIV
jgi:hypothetical protein